MSSPERVILLSRSGITGGQWEIVDYGKRR